MDDTRRNSAVYQFLQLNYEFLYSPLGGAFASPFGAIEMSPRFRAGIPLSLDHYLHELYNGFRLDHGRVDSKMIVTGIPHVRMEVLFHQPPVFLIQLGNVLSCITL
jgi:hypothetical protein